MLRRSFAVLLPCLVTCLFQSGCVRSTTRFSETGTIVDLKTCKQIVPGETPKAWVIGMFGRPTGTYRDDDGREVLRYEGVRTKNSRFDVELLLHLVDADEDTRTRQTVFFEITDGIVQRYWSESVQVAKDSDLRLLN